MRPTKIAGKLYSALPESKLKEKVGEKLLQEIKNSLKGWKFYRPKDREQAKQKIGKAIDKAFDHSPNNHLVGLKIEKHYFDVGAVQPIYVCDSCGNSLDEPPANGICPMCGQGI